MRHTELLSVPHGYRVSIVHINKPAALAWWSMGKKSPKYGTLAFVYDEATGEIVADGDAFCSPKDNPSRKLGRVIAHNRAVSRLLDTLAHSEEA